MTRDVCLPAGSWSVSGERGPDRFGDIWLFGLFGLEIFGCVGCLVRRGSRGRAGNVPIPGKAAGSD